MSVRMYAALAAASVITLHAVRPALSQGGTLQLEQAAYEAFREKFGADRGPEDEKTYENRVALFHRRSEEVKKHNALNLGWALAVNKFSDFTDEEFHGLLGHRPSQRFRSAGTRANHASSFVAVAEHIDIAEAVDYRSTLNATLAVKNQGACGSCWAVAVAGSLETHAEARTQGQEIPQASYEELVDCVPNPEHCGGTGGCQGATSELAFEYIAAHGLGAMDMYSGYQHDGDGSCRPPSSKALTTDGFVRLPENQARPLRDAVANHGPVVVSAWASAWGSYGHGVFGGCAPDAAVNHAILMMGYGADSESGKNYWLIRNSWGTDWGEDGYIRLLRHDDDENYCGVDHEPLEGVGCVGGPAELPVCGMCGILADSAYPTGVKIAERIL